MCIFIHVCKFMCTHVCVCMHTSIQEAAAAIPPSCQVPQEPWAPACPFHIVLGNRKAACSLWSNTSFLFKIASHFLTDLRIVPRKEAKELNSAGSVLQLRLSTHLTIWLFQRKEPCLPLLLLSTLFPPSSSLSPPFSLTSFLSAKRTLL